MRYRIDVRLLPTVTLFAATLLVGCRDNPLDVLNKQQPDVQKAYGTPANVESIVSKLFQQMWNAQHNASDNIQTQSITMSFESHSQLGNFGMGTRAAIPRSLIDNSIGNAVATGNFRDFDALSRNARSATNSIAAIDRFKALPLPLSIGSPARDARAKAWAFFNLGYAMGQLALFYDSAAIITPKTPTAPEDPASTPPFSPAADVLAYALQAFDSALAISNSADATNGTNGWPIPQDWVSDPGAAGVTIARFRQIVRSYKAKFRAGVARTPTARAAVDWAEVIADATNGITADFVVLASVSNGWGTGWVTQMRVSSGWSQMTPMILGMGDTTGAYDNWLAVPIGSRSPKAFSVAGQAEEDKGIMRTPDKRFPSGETRAAQIAVTGNTKGGPAAGSILYFRNRPVGEDTPAEPWGTWYYDNWRNWAIGAAGGNGPYPLFTIVENDMLAAEGYLRTGQVALAATLIDKSRVRAGLAPVTGIVDLTTPVSGGAKCVPRVPQPPNYTTTACGNIFEAMKWEKRLETSFTGYGQWYVDSRGWGDLVQGTGLEWPVPYQELYSRQLPSYTNTVVAVRGTYGF
jgi:hypothetical protein